MSPSGQSEHLKNFSATKRGVRLPPVFGDNKGYDPVGGQVAAENFMSPPLGKENCFPFTSR